MKRSVATAGLLVGTAAGLTLLSATSTVAQESMDALIDTMRTEFAKYQDVNVALADGFIPDPSGHCVSAAEEGLPPEWGAMGIHYLNPVALQLVDGPRVDGMAANDDPMAPPILLYEPQADGTLQLLGVELLVFQDAWTAAGHDGPPMFAGQEWNAMADDPATDADEAHGFVPHYDLHVWLYRDNPAGILAPFNTNVTCEYHAGD